MFNFQAIKKVFWLQVLSLLIFIFNFVLLNKGPFKCSLLHPVAQESGSIKAYGMKTLSDPILVPPICFNVVQVIMLTRVHHKLKENVNWSYTNMNVFQQWNYSRFVYCLVFIFVRIPFPLPTWTVFSTICISLECFLSCLVPLDSEEWSLLTRVPLSICCLEICWLIFTGSRSINLHS